MITKLLDVTTENIRLAGDLVAEGKLVAFPTETVYGLGADALNGEAVEKIYAAKGRPSDNPMIVHIAEKEELNQLTPCITQMMHGLMESFWPGPLTMVVNKLAQVPDVTTGGLGTVAIRMPSDETARQLIRSSGRPIAAPSANISGRPSPTKAEHVKEDLDGKIDAILIGGDCQVGIESTVIDVTGDDVVVLRPGIITPEQLAEVVNPLGKKVTLDPALLVNRPRDVSAESFQPKSPGMKYKHYAPKAQMTIISGETSQVGEKIENLKLQLEAEGKKVGVILFEETQLQEAAHDFFAKLREMDGQAVDVILAGALDVQTGVGFAVMNRMVKSAGYCIIKV